MLLATDGQVDLGDRGDGFAERRERCGLLYFFFRRAGGSCGSFEREVILAELKRSHSNVSLAAKALGLERSHLYKKAEQLGIDLRAMRREQGVPSSSAELDRSLAILSGGRPNR